MPTLPRVTGPGVEQQGLPGARLSAASVNGDAFGAGTGEQLAQVGKVGQAFATRLQDRENADEVFRADAALKTEYLEYERSELARNGADVKGAAERAQKWWAERARTYTEVLKNDRQRALFDRSFTRLQMASTETLMRHEQTQLNKSLVESASARAASAIETGIADPTPERLALAKGEITSAIDVVGKLAGHTPEIIEQSKQKHLTQLHKGVILSLVDKDPDAAKAHYFANKKEIAGSERAVIEKALEAGSLDATAQTAADDIMGKFTTEAEAMAYVEKTFSGKEEVRVRQEVAMRFNTRDASAKKTMDDAYDQGRLLVARNQKVPQALLLTMGDGHAAALLEHQQARAKAARAEAEGKAVKTDFGVWNTLNAMAAQDPEGFAKLDLGRFQDRVSKQDLMEFGNLQRAITTKPDKAIPEIASVAGQIGAVAEDMGLTGKARGKFTRTVQSALSQAQAIKGKPLTYEERQKVIDQQVMEVTVEDGGFLFFDGRKRAFELTEEERAEVVVPDADRAEIEAELRKRGRKPDEATVRAIYLGANGIGR